MKQQPPTRAGGVDALVQRPPVNPRAQLLAAAIPVRPARELPDAVSANTRSQPAACRASSCPSAFSLRVETRAYPILMCGIVSETSGSPQRPAEFRARVSDDRSRACRLVVP